MTMKNHHNDIKDTSECRDSLRRTFSLYLRDDLPPYAKKQVEEFIDLVIKVAGDEFECISCRTKNQISGVEGFIL